MEFAEAGVEDRPDARAGASALTSSPQAQYNESSSFPQIPMSSMRDEPDERSRLKAEKKKRKELRAAKRAEKEARRQKRKSLKAGPLDANDTIAQLEPEAESEVLVPSSGVAARPSNYEVSVTPPRRYSPSRQAYGFDKEDSDDQEAVPTTLAEEQIAGPSTPLAQSGTASAAALAPTSEPSRKKDKGKSRLVVEVPSSSSTPGKDKGKSKASEPAPSAQPTPETSQKKEEEKTKGKAKAKYQLEVELPSSTNGAKKRPRQSGGEVDGTAPAPADADASNVAGPSKPPKKTKSTTTPKKPRPSRASLTPSSKGLHNVTRPTEDELRARLVNSAAISDFLAMRFWPPPYLNKLEEAGILTIKKGKLSEEEVRAIRNHLDLFAKANRLRDDQLVEVVMGKGKDAARSEYPDFWRDITLELPGRPIRYVVKMVQRMYDPRGRKGAWTAQEDADLIRAYDIYPNAWIKIAEIVDRTEQDCRDRWNKEINNTEKRNNGAWTKDEEDNLVQAIKEANNAVGNDALSKEAPWEAVAAKMGHVRGPTQCRVKWQRHLLPIKLGLRPANTPERRPGQPKAKRGAQPWDDPEPEPKPKKQPKPKPVKVKYPIPAKSQEFIDDSDDDVKRPPPVKKRKRDSWSLSSGEDEDEGEGEGEDEIEVDPTPIPNGHDRGRSETDEIEPDSDSDKEDQD